MTALSLRCGPSGGPESVTLPASANQGSLHVFAIGSDAAPLTK
ncbi:MAG: hypothetical protein WAL22_06750 [Solirubrobacteraceae bacterium]